MFSSISQLANVDYLLDRLEMIEPMLKTGNRIELIKSIHNLVPEYIGLKSEYENLNA